MTRSTSNTEENLSALREGYLLLSSNPERAREILEDLAKENSVMSMVYLGRSYAPGGKFSEDFERAKMWYLRAAEQGSLFARYSLAKLLLKKKYLEEARRHLELAAEQNYPPALHELGLMYRDGRGVEQDIVKSLAYLRESSALGHIFAKRDLAMVVRKNNPNAASYVLSIFLLVQSFLSLFRTFFRREDSTDRLI